MIHSFLSLRYTLSLATFLSILIICPERTFSQLNPVIKGSVRNEKNEPLAAVAIRSARSGSGTQTNQAGNFSISIQGISDTLIFSLTGYRADTVPVQNLTNLEVVLYQSVKELGQVTVTDHSEWQSGMTSLDARSFQLFPNASQSLESMLKQLPGVSTNNELSSQYTVRGGNFDENLIYINDIQIFKPYLVRNGQQEGLSMINPDMAGAVKFSAGGFSARYGDKMSSVLDVQYAVPQKSGAVLSLATNALSLTGKIKTPKTDLIFGYRKKNNQSLLSSQDVKGVYQPDFNDLQGVLNYRISSSWSASVLGILNENRFFLSPESRETSFGTLRQAYRFRVNYKGQEDDSYLNSLVGFTLRHQTERSQWKWINSFFSMKEKEHFDIYGTYVFTDGSSPGGLAGDRGIGAFQDYGRNEMNAQVWASELQWNFQAQKSYWQSGIRFQHEDISDHLNEFNLLDSAGYMVSGSSSPLNYRFANNDVSTTQINAFIDNVYRWTNFSLQTGIRGTYNSFTGEFIPSPRLSVTFSPAGKKDISYRLATGLYAQPPFYREMRNLDGSINKNIKSQKAIHAIFSSNYHFQGLGTRLTFATEWYYKHLFDLIPYEVDNLRIRYLADQKAEGYALGVDFSLKGELVTGLESAFRLSLMQTKEDIEGDLTGFIKRPTDQRVNFSAFFQDKLFNSPTYKIHMNLLFGSRLPTWPPRVAKGDQDFKIPAYRRLDIGFSKDLLDKEGRNHMKFLKSNFDAFILYAEIFNLLNINNTVSYLWIQDIRGDHYAVPNYLTSRQLNLKVIVKF